jgi:hypothetical protein
MAMGVSFGIGSYIEGGVVAGIIVLNIVIGFMQEYSAEKTLDSLRSLSSPSKCPCENLYFVWSCERVVLQWILNQNSFQRYSWWTGHCDPDSEHGTVLPSDLL